MAKLYMVEQHSSPSLLLEALSLFTKLYTQFIDAKMLIDEETMSIEILQLKEALDS